MDEDTTTEICLTPIGRIHSPYLERSDAPRQGAVSAEKMILEIFPPYQPGLGSMTGITHIYVLYWMDKADRTRLSARRSDWNHPRPVFTIRSPDRPNPIAISIARIMKVADGIIEVTRLDAMDGSFILDIKPYIPSIDCIPDA
ncbi:MAG: tRNA (N6-threonylcarbamoyladenosine(37)-N6)-methyltransferase TrmO [Methanospirillaceae archaeon]|nr:tRNA (N6-threonylcarbamoyladenosine(37)-N6)-methyltransferase TrmO [Methanospirillaceae archaeon]